MRQAGLKDSDVKSVRISYVYDIFPERVMTKFFKSQKAYYDWTMTSDAQRYHIVEITLFLEYNCKFKQQVLF